MVNFIDLLIMQVTTLEFGIACFTPVMFALTSATQWKSEPEE